MALIPLYTGNVPNRLDSPETFSSDTDYYHSWLPDAVEAMNSVATAMNLNETNSTSSTSLLIGTGSKSLTVETNKSYQAGMYVVLADTAAPSTNSMVAQITSYNSSTGAMVVNSLAISGSGTKTAWTISQSAKPSTITSPVPIVDGGTGATTAAAGLTALGGASLTSLAADTGAALIGFKQSGTGAVSTTLDSLLKDTVTVKQFGAVGNGIADDTAAVQAAINTGKNVDFLGLNCAVNNLTQSTAGQTLYSSSGFGKLTKNANGAVITSTANDVSFINILAYGDASSPVFTGDGIVATGARPKFINCGSRWMQGRALKATGDRVIINGTGDIWQTTDSTATGYDIEIGVSGTATLYHNLDDVYTSQSDGGILMTDTGSHTIKGGLFGKLSILAGTTPGGANGGKTVGARILGDMTIGLSGAIFSGNQLGAVVCTLQAGTANCSIDASNTRETGFTIVNNGNLTTNLIVTQTGTTGGAKLRVGDDTSVANIQFNPSDATQALQFSGGVTIPNTRSYRAYNSGGSLLNLIGTTAGDVVNVGSTSAARTDVNGPSINFNSTAGTQVQVVDGALRPFSTNTKTLGTSALKWNQSYVTTMFVGSGTAQFTSGTGSPEGVLTASVGSWYTRTDGGAGTTLYVKESGTGNTGWVAK